MKKLLFIILSFVLLGSFVWAEDNQSKKDNNDSNSKKCEQVCVQWEKRKDCRKDPVFPDRKICAVYEVCTKYEEKCK